MNEASELIVIDTNIVSYIFNQDDKANYYLERMRGTQWSISFQTLEELWCGAYSKGWGRRRKIELERYLERYEVIWPDRELVDVCARLCSERRSAGRRLQEADAWVAATAIKLNCKLASHDRDFSGIPGLRLLQAL